MTWLYNFSFSCTCGPLSWVIPAEIFDTRTRSKGVSIATMVSFAFNTLIGQVTDMAMTNIGYKFYFLFIICNFTNALFFYLFLPETARKPLEEMNYLFTHAPILVSFPFYRWPALYIQETQTLTAKQVPGTDKASYNAGYAADIERRAQEISDKSGVDVEHYQGELDKHRAGANPAMGVAWWIIYEVMIISFTDVETGYPNINIDYLLHCWVGAVDFDDMSVCSLAPCLMRCCVICMYLNWMLGYIPFD